MKKHYTIKGTTILADVEKLTEKELSVLGKYIALGYTVKANAVIERDSLTEEDILSYLGEDEKAVQTYRNACNELTINKNGEEQTRGFNNGLFWFEKTYPLNLDEANEEIKKAKKEKDLAKSYAEYKKGKGKEKAKAKKNGEDETLIVELTEEEYIRYFYWKKVWTRK